MLHGIKEDPNAGRAPRDDMIEEFEGLDRYIPRPVRHDLVQWRDAGQIAISRLTLPDTVVTSLPRGTVMAIEGRWNLDSPLRRAVLSALGTHGVWGRRSRTSNSPVNCCLSPHGVQACPTSHDGGSTGSGADTGPSHAVLPRATAGSRSRTRRGPARWTPFSSFRVPSEPCTGTFSILSTCTDSP